MHITDVYLIINVLDKPLIDYCNHECNGKIRFFSFTLDGI